jgi:RHS repeat-associated protein
LVGSQVVFDGNYPQPLMFISMGNAHFGQGPPLYTIGLPITNFQSTSAFMGAPATGYFNFLINVPASDILPVDGLGQPQFYPLSLQRATGVEADGFAQNDSGVLSYNEVSYTGPITSITNCGSPGSSPDSSLQPDKDLGDNSCCVADPITISNGNVFEEVTDYQTAGTNTLGFTRYYNSLASSNTLAYSLGVNWRSTYERYLRLSAGSIAAERANGQTLLFRSSRSAWVSDSDVDIQLVQTGSGFTLTDNNDTVETYTMVSAAVAVLSSVRTRNGYEQDLRYGIGNQLLSVTDSFSRSLIFSYQGSLLQTVTTPDGLVLTYGYGASGGGSPSPRLTSVSYSTTPATSKTYLYEYPNLPFALTGIVDENGNRYASWKYDGFGRGTSSQLGNGADLATIAYSDTDGSRTVTNAVGQKTVYRFATLQDVPKVVEIDRIASPTIPAASRLFTYDSNGYIASQTDWNGNATTYVNNAHGLPAIITEAAGTPQARTTNIAYDSTWVHLPASKVTPGLTTSFTYDASGNLLTRTLTDTTSATVPYSTNGTTRTWKYAWTNGLLASATGPRDDVKQVTQFDHDSSGALTATTNALGQVNTVTQHTPGGLPLSVTDANGVVTAFGYDARLRLLSSAVNTSAGVLTKRISYDAAGNLISTTQPDGSTIANKYDAAHRLIGMTDLFQQSISYTLDALGDRTKTTVTDASGILQRAHSGSFDPLGRVLNDIGGAGQGIAYLYDGNGNVVSATDSLSHTTTTAFDALNHPITITDPAGNVTFRAYDAHDRVVSVTDPNGGTTSYTFDGFGDLIQQVSPTTGTTVYRYDAAGNLIQRVDARGVVANYTYDALDRVATTSYPGNPAENITYTYDEAGHGFGIGRLTSLADAAGKLSRIYDERGDAVSEARVLGSTTLSTAYGYDAAQRIASIGYPSGWTTGYTRDAMGRVTGVTAQAAEPTGAKPIPVVSNIAYEPFGPPNSLTFGNGVVEKRTFDGDYRETARTDGGKATIQKLSYLYDGANNVTAIADAVTASNSQAFGYDALDRLTSANGGYGKLGYSYDAIGNRIADSFTATSPVLDGLGAISALAYNQAGRVSTVTAGSNQVAGYAYDAFGQRLARTGTNAMLFQYDLSGHLLEETDGQGSPQADYAYLGDQPIASVAPGTGNVYFLHDDRLGTPQVATDKNQTIMWQANYQPFGATSTGVGLIAQDLRLPGQEFDSVTGWYHNGFREYVSAWGRYSQSDPIGAANLGSVYAYASGDPIGRSDRLGLADANVAGQTFTQRWQQSYNELNQLKRQGIDVATATSAAIDLTQVTERVNSLFAFSQALGLSYESGGLFAGRIFGSLAEYLGTAVLEAAAAERLGELLGVTIDALASPYTEDILDFYFELSALARGICSR